MKHSRLINRDHIVKVIRHDKEENLWYSHRKESRIFGLLITKECFKDLLGNVFSVDQLPDYLFVIDKTVYVKYHISIHMSNGDMIRKYFDTEVKRDEYYLSVTMLIDRPLQL